MNEGVIIGWWSVAQQRDNVCLVSQGVQVKRIEPTSAEGFPPGFRLKSKHSLQTKSGRTFWCSQEIDFGRWPCWTWAPLPRPLLIARWLITALLDCYFCFLIFNTGALITLLYLYNEKEKKIIGIITDRAFIYDNIIPLVIMPHINTHISDSMRKRCLAE